MREQGPSAEYFSEREQVLINRLRAKGPEDPETRDLLTAWTEEGERDAEADPSVRGHIQFNLRRSRLYLAAGFHEAAIEGLKEVYYEAIQNRQEDLQAAAAEILNVIA